MPLDTLPPLPPELPPLPASPREERVALPPPEPEGDEEEEVVYHVLSEVGADDTSSLAEHGEGEASERVCSAEEEVYEGRSAAEEDDYDLEELERLAQRKMEILKAIELPDSVVRAQATLCFFRNAVSYLLYSPLSYLSTFFVFLYSLRNL